MLLPSLSVARRSVLSARRSWVRMVVTLQLVAAIGAWQAVSGCCDAIGRAALVVTVVGVDGADLRLAAEVHAFDAESGAELILSWGPMDYAPGRPELLPEYPWEFDYDAGSYEIVASAPGYEPARRTVRVGADRCGQPHTKSVTMTLEPESGLAAAGL
ncbi:MAG: hypothetical protein H6744_17820 [Deltaproteobacteria bacterium]|nr:hypothetical protein [Deltaproteobacteria bacterium]